MHRLIPILLLGAAFCFALGLTLPLIHLEKLYFFTETPSLVEVVRGLWEDSAYLIAFVVVLFSFIFPFLKMLTVYFAAFELASGRGDGGLPSWVSVLSKWSMMDVLLVALVVFAAKTSGFATAITQPGIWFYAISAIATAVAAGLLKRQRSALHAPLKASVSDKA